MNGPNADQPPMPMPDMLAKRLRWRCRRGMRELDRLLESRLAFLLMQRDDDALAGFERLLDCEDDQLWRWCLGHDAPLDPQIAIAVDAVRAHRPA